jgi:hypothetical protein
MTRTIVSIAAGDGTAAAADDADADILIQILLFELYMLYI